MRVAFVANPVAGAWSPLEPDTWGGGEEIISQCPPALVAAGCEVDVFTDDGAAIGEYRGARYRKRSEASGQYDAMICFKCPEAAALRLAPLPVLWTDQERTFDVDPLAAIFACSEYVARHLASRMPRGVERLDVLRYGIDTAEVDAAKVERDPNLVVHAASPDRGLETLLRVWPQVVERYPAARLEILYGWDLYERCGGDRRLRQRIEHALGAMPSARMARLPRTESHAALWRAQVFAYYCTGGEQFGLTLMKALQAGCTPVVKPWGALGEQLRGRPRVSTPAEMVAGIVDALQAPPPTPVPGRDWSEVAEEWKERLTRLTTQPVLGHFLREVPPPPPFTAPPGWNVGGVIQPTLQDFVGLAPRVWIADGLGLNPGNAASPAEADVVVLGFEIEDGTEPVEAQLAALGLRAGTPVLMVTSTGGWRADRRQRALDPHDLEELFGACPEYETVGLLLDDRQHGVLLTKCRYYPTRMGRRDLARAMRMAAPRETLTACLMVRDCARDLPRCLDSVREVADAIRLVVTGGTEEDTVAAAKAWTQANSVPVDIRYGTSPRWCYDCEAEHDVGDMSFGHRWAGFETPRNQSIVGLTTDWYLWIDADEILHHGWRLGRYLRPNLFKGYSIQQHHHSVEPRDAARVDLPCRVVRVMPAEQPSGLHPYGPLEWPTYGTGLTTRFGGVIHEHPGIWPHYLDGTGPAMVLGDVHITHLGYETNDARQKRFVRNWPLMVADRQKYPDRRLGKFLWLRDLLHQMAHLTAQRGGQPGPESIQLAEEAEALFARDFVETADMFSPEALNFRTGALRLLQRGQEWTIAITAKRPETTGEEAATLQASGRFNGPDEVLKFITARLSDFRRWDGDYQ